MTLTINHYETGTVLYRLPDPGYLRIGGEHRRDFIQRQTTNDIHQLTADHPLLTVLTSATARILDVWRLVLEPDDTIGVITLPGRGGAIVRYLQNRIFFMDRVMVTDASADFAQFDLFGPGAPDWLKDSMPGQVIQIADQRYRLLIPAGQADGLIAVWSLPVIAPDDYDVLRIEAGVPGPVRELTEDFTPLEANLDAAISGTKGCYTGQEIIARQISYDKITRRLVGLRLESAALVGAAVLVEDRRVGEITSAVESPRFGPIALAVIKRPHHEPGTRVSVTVDDQTIGGDVVPLPFG